MCDVGVERESWIRQVCVYHALLRGTILAGFWCFLGGFRGLRRDFGHFSPQFGGVCVLLGDSAGFKGLKGKFAELMDFLGELAGLEAFLGFF